MEHAKVNETEKVSLKPSTLFLIILNALIFLCLLLPGLNPVGWILAVPMTLVFMAISGIWHGIWIFFNQKFHPHNIIRCLGFVLPVAGLVVLPYLGFEPSRPINKQKPAISESGQFSAFVIAEPSGWNVEIRNMDGLSLLDYKTEMIPHLNVFWIWGPADTFWLYNSDDGQVHCWHQIASDWKHTVWGHGHKKKTKEDLGMPPFNLYPDYAR